VCYGRSERDARVWKNKNKKQKNEKKKKIVYIRSTTIAALLFDQNIYIRYARVCVRVCTLVNGRCRGEVVGDGGARGGGGGGGRGAAAGSRSDDIPTWLWRERSGPGMRSTFFIRPSTHTPRILRSPQRERERERDQVRDQVPPPPTAYTRIHTSLYVHRTYTDARARKYVNARACRKRGARDDVHGPNNNNAYNTTEIVEIAAQRKFAASRVVMT